MLRGLWGGGLKETDARRQEIRARVTIDSVYHYLRGSQYLNPSIALSTAGSRGARWVQGTIEIDHSGGFLVGAPGIR